MSAVDAYSGPRAAGYDESSAFDKGNRAFHRLLLGDLLDYLPAPRRFVDLGCGTGAFTETLLSHPAGLSGVAVDGSPDMLELARRRLAPFGGRVRFEQARLEALPWERFGPAPDLVFSALAVHHLADEEKWALFSDIRGRLAGGAFVLFDQFRTGDRRADELLEYLACTDLRRRLAESLELDPGLDLEELRLERLIERDRQIKRAEGDREARLADLVEALAAAGFDPVTVVYQEARFAALVAFNPEPVASPGTA